MKQINQDTVNLAMELHREKAKNRLAMMTLKKILNGELDEIDLEKAIETIEEL